MRESEVTIDLEFPVQLADRVMDHVIMRRPTMGDARKYPIKGREDIIGEMKLIAALCKLRLEEIDQVAQSDYEGRLVKAYLRFRAPSKARGDKDDNPGLDPVDPVGSDGDSGHDL